MVFDTGRRKPIGYLKLHVFFAIEPLIIGLFSGKWHIKIRHTMDLRHPVREIKHVYINERTYVSIYETILKSIFWKQRTIFRCLKLQVSFRKRAANYRALLRAMKRLGSRSFECKDLSTDLQTEVCGYMKSNLWISREKADKHMCVIVSLHAKEPYN